MTVANVLNYKNHRSVGNRIALLKKKYNLPIGVSTSKVAEESNGSAQKNGDEPGGHASPGDAKVPKTPSKQRVTKPRVSTGGKKTPVKPRGKGKGKEDDDEGPLDLKQEDSTDKLSAGEVATTKQERAEEGNKVSGAPASDQEYEGDAEEA